MSDDFTIVVPATGQARLVRNDRELAALMADPLLRISKTVALRDGRSVKGSVYRGRETTASDELQIFDLLNEAFGA